MLAGFIAFSKLQNTYNYLAAACFTCDYLKILNFDTKNLSPPTVFELETWNLAVILFTSFLTTLFSRIFELGPQFQNILTIMHLIQVVKNKLLGIMWTRKLPSLKSIAQKL